MVVSSTCFLCSLEAGAAARLTNAPPMNGEVVISWNSRGTLENANQIIGPWTTITNAANLYTNAIKTGSQFFRLNQTVDAELGAALARARELGAMSFAVGIGDAVDPALLLRLAGEPHRVFLTGRDGLLPSLWPGGVPPRCW